MNVRPAATLVALAATVVLVLAPGPAQAYESKRLGMNVWSRCTPGDVTRVVVRLHDTRPPNPEATPQERMRPYAWTWKHSDDGAPWNTWGGADYTENRETVYLRFHLAPDQQWIRVAVSDETDTEYARHLMLDRRFYSAC